MLKLVVVDRAREGSIKLILILGNIAQFENNYSWVFFLELGIIYVYIYIKKRIVKILPDTKPLLCSKFI